ncbi:MAG TPA: hypothetical protein VJJ02_02235 [Candidatus Paceibacterota bacterium]
MDEFLKMDVFFVVTTAVVLVGGALCLVALFYSIKILRNVDNVVRNVSEESDNVRGDLSVLRRKIHEEGMKVKHFTDFLGGVAARQKSRKKVEKIK